MGMARLLDPGSLAVCSFLLLFDFGCVTEAEEIFFFRFTSCGVSIGTEFILKYRTNIFSNKKITSRRTGLYKEQVR